jgi:mannitol-specific phosphotransferase system IIBC component
MSPNDILVHCETAQHVAFSSLGEAAFLTVIIATLATMLVGGMILNARNDKDNKAWYEQNKRKFDGYESEKRAYENDREDLRKEKNKLVAEHNERMVELVRQGNEYSKRSYDLAVREKRLGVGT